MLGAWPRFLTCHSCQIEVKLNLTCQNLSKIMDIRGVRPSGENYAETEELSEGEDEPAARLKKPLNMKPGAVKLRNWLNKTLRVEMSDGRVLIGIFLCTDREANIILGSCAEYLPGEQTNETTIASNDDARMLGLVMVPGKHIVNVCIDQNEHTKGDHPLNSEVSEEVM